MVVGIRVVMGVMMVMLLAREGQGEQEGLK